MGELKVKPLSLSGPDFYIKTRVSADIALGVSTLFPSVFSRNNTHWVRIFPRLGYLATWTEGAHFWSPHHHCQIAHIYSAPSYTRGLTARIQQGNTTDFPLQGARGFSEETLALGRYPSANRPSAPGLAAVTEPRSSGFPEEGGCPNQPI